MTKSIYILALGFISTNSMAQTQVYSEDFQNGLPISYSIVDNDGFTPNAAVIEFADAWISMVDPDNPNDTIVGSTSYFEPVGQADRWLITPAIALGASGNFLYWDAKSHDPSFPDDYLVLASKTDVQLASFTDTLIHVAGESFEWNYRELNLSDAGLDGETVHIAFVNRTNDGFKLYLDSISVNIDDPVGLETLASLEVNVYPNPTEGKVTISGAFDRAIVYSLAGTILLETSLKSIDLTSFESGVYQIIILQGDRIHRTRIIKN